MRLFASKDLSAALRADTQREEDQARTMTLNADGDPTAEAKALVQRGGYEVCTIAWDQVQWKTPTEVLMNTRGRPDYFGDVGHGWRVEATIPIAGDPAWLETRGSKSRARIEGEIRGQSLTWCLEGTKEEVMQSRQHYDRWKGWVEEQLGWLREEVAAHKAETAGRIQRLEIILSERMQNQREIEGALQAGG